MVGVGSTTGSTAGAGRSVGVGSATTGAMATTSSGVGSTVVSGAGAAFLAAAFFAGAASPEAAFLAAAFLTGLASSGCSSRVSPSRTARRSSRSACASISELDWFFTPTPMTSHSDNSSALVIPSFLASSCTRMFFAKLLSAFPGTVCDGRFFHCGGEFGECHSQPFRRIEGNLDSPCSLKPVTTDRQIDAAR
jgi:hypothetical protein